MVHAVEPGERSQMAIRLHAMADVAAALGAVSAVLSYELPDGSLVIDGSVAGSRALIEGHRIRMGEWLEEASPAAKWTPPA